MPCAYHCRGPGYLEAPRTVANWELSQISILGLISKDRMSKNQQLTAAKKLANRNLRQLPSLSCLTSAWPFNKEEHVVQIMSEQKHIAEHKQADDDDRHPKKPSAL
jgi:hypothetical protein